MRGLKFIIYIFISLWSAPKTQSAHEGDLELVSGADFWRNLFVEADPFPGLPETAAGPEGRKSANEPGAGLPFIFPKVCPLIEIIADSFDIATFFFRRRTS